MPNKSSSKKKRGKSKADDIKHKATDRMAETADRVRNAGRDFGRGSYQAQAADYLADNLIEAAGRIRSRNLDGLAQDVGTFARRNPAVVLGGAALLGFAAARLFKSSDTGGRG